MGVLKIKDKDLSPFKIVGAYFAYLGGFIVVFNLYFSLTITQKPQNTQKMQTLNEISVAEHITEKTSQKGAGQQEKPETSKAQIAKKEESPKQEKKQEPKEIKAEQAEKPKPKQTIQIKPQKRSQEVAPVKKEKALEREQPPRKPIEAPLRKPKEEPKKSEFRLL